MKFISRVLVVPLAAAFVCGIAAAAEEKSRHDEWREQIRLGKEGKIEAAEGALFHPVDAASVRPPKTFEEWLKVNPSAQALADADKSGIMDDKERAELRRQWEGVRFRQWIQSYVDAKQLFDKNNDGILNENEKAEAFAFWKSGKGDAPVTKERRLEGPQQGTGGQAPAAAEPAPAAPASAAAEGRAAQ